jgi:hypothetical protein
MFDLSGSNVPSDFNDALLARGNLDIIDCPGKNYAYDTSNGIDSIVYQVRNIAYQILKTGFEKIIYCLDRCSFLLGFIMSKKHERLHTELLIRI